jgi:RimJ/RimL family protein N-acetyltransferase
MIATFQTPRLTAERLQAHHLGELCRMHGDPAVMATLGGLRPEDETRRFLAEGLAHWDRHGYGLWVVRDLRDTRFAGRAGLRHVHVGGADEVELAYALMAEFWGRGMATELSRALLTVAFEHLRLDDLVCFTLRTNRASQRVMEKAGFTFEREVSHAGMPHVLYRMHRPAAPHRGGNDTA